MVPDTAPMTPAEATEEPCSLHEILREVIAFRDARDWAQFHTPRNLATALSIEAGELQEAMLWKTEAEIAQMIRENPRDLRRECADVLVYALLFCHAVGADPAEIIREKLAENARKYPVDLARGRATKYTQLAGEPAVSDERPSES